MARIERIHHRLEIWAMWKVAGGTGAGMASNMAMWEEDRVDGELNYHGAILGTINEEECARTDAAILKLPDPLGITVALYYIEDSGRTRKKLAISDSTLSQRLGEADRKLDELLRAPSKSMAGQLPTGWMCP